MMQRFTIILFVLSLLSSNAIWAGDGQLNDIIDNIQHVAMDIDCDAAPDVTPDTIHHVVDEHHDGHDCHMSAHLIGINSTSLSLADFSNAHAFSVFVVSFSSNAFPPPSKPPRAS